MDETVRRYEHGRAVQYLQQILESDDDRFPILARKPYTNPDRDETHEWTKLRKIHMPDLGEVKNLDVSDMYVGDPSYGWIKVGDLPDYGRYGVYVRKRLGWEAERRTLEQLGSTWIIKKR